MKMIKLGLIVFCLLPFPVTAADDEVDEATKAWALKRAHQLNAGFMNGPMIDLSNEKPFLNPVKTVPVPVAILPPDPPTPEARLAKMKHVEKAAEPNNRTCKRHGLRKVTMGKRWRCRK